MSRVTANLLLLLAGLVWGAAFVAQSSAMRDIGPLWFVGIRFCIAALVVAPLAMREARLAPAPVPAKTWKGFFSIGLALFGGATLQQSGLLSTSVTNSGFLTGLYVVMVPALTVLFLRRRPHAIVWVAALMACGGTLLLGGGRLSGFNAGDALTLGCAVFWSFQVLLVGIHAGNSARPFALCVTQFAVCGLLACAAACVFEHITFSAIRAAMLPLLYAGVLSSGVAFTLQVVAQRHTSASQAAVFMASEAPFAALFGAWLMGDRLGLPGYAGCTLIFAAMLLVEIVPELMKRRNARQA